LGGFIANVGVSDVVDEPLFEQLKNAGLASGKPSRRDSDALHLMYAVHHHCDWFVTLDSDFTTELEPLCRGLRIVRPSELVAELEGI
jgi:predicted nucleic acid-binding protein